MHSQRKDYDEKINDLKIQLLKEQETERKRSEIREREMDRQNIELRQKLLEESNRIVFKETSLRNYAELQAKENQMEKEVIERRYKEVKEQLQEVQAFKETYTLRTEDSMSR